MIKVYFQSETGSHSELVATFTNDDLYNRALPSLEKLAAEIRCFVTETVSQLNIEDATASETEDYTESKVYEVGIDLGEMGTQTIAKFDVIEEAQAFMDVYRLADSTSHLFIDTITSDFTSTLQN